MDQILQTSILGIEASRWLTSLVVALAGIIVAVVIRSIGAALVRRREREKEEAAATERRRAFVLRTVRSFLSPGIVIGSFYLAATQLGLPAETERLIASVFVVLFSIAAIRFLVAVVNELFTSAAENAHGGRLTRIRPLRAIAVFAVWVVGLLFLLDNLGINITTIVAGLGIGGIAVALAAQAILGDLFSYFVIIFDRPFELGDFLIFGDILGSVERIGVKTTRLRSLGGELIVVSNSDLTNSRVRNYKRMQSRRVVFTIGVVYATPSELVREIPSVIKAIVDAEELATFDRAHFARYGDWSLVYEVVYYVASPDYNLYMDVQQRINFGIHDAFAERGIEFAFPTQTIALQGQSRS